MKFVKIICMSCVGFVSACVSAPLETPSVGSVRVDDIGHQTQRLEKLSAELTMATNALCVDRGETALCDLQVKLDPDPRLRNAYFQVTAGQQRSVTVGLGLLMAAENDSEVFFVLAHEVGHQLAGHERYLVGSTQPERRNFSANGGGFELHRMDTSKVELEADAVGTILTHSAGYDALEGAQAFFRFGPQSHKASSSHPDPNTRLRLVQRVVAALDAGHQINF